MIDLSVLNEMQRKAVETTEGPLLILAGAGSGKTRALTYRVAHLIDKGVPPYRIMALTFTNKAAKEMKERIASLAGEAGGEAWVSTFHSSCAKILRRDIEKLGYTRSFTIYDDDDQGKVIKDILKSMNIDEKVLPPKEIRANISDAKNKLQSPDEWFAASQKDFRIQMIHDVFTEYERRLRAANALDFDDLLVKTLELFVEQPPVLEYYRDRFLYVHVDEYQDTNYAQYMLMKLISDKYKNVCVVGDDDQSIYGWRGADIRNILDFEKDYPGCTVIKLEQNYRSTSNILDAANQVIAHNAGRKEKTLWTDKDGGEKIKVIAAGDEHEEGAWICHRARELANQDFKFGDMAVLYRTNAQSRVLEEMLVRSGIPYRIFGGTKFYDRREVKDVLAYLRVIDNPADDVSVARIINTPKRSIGDSTVNELREFARKQEISLFAAALTPPDTLSSRAAKSLQVFADLMSELMALSQTMGLSEFVELMVSRVGLLSQYQKEKNDEDQSRAENVQEFMGAVKEFVQKSQPEEGQTLIQMFLENVSLVTELDRADETPNYMTLMTLHTAKGLEFPVVFIAGMEDGIFPSARCEMDENRLEEERRLCYVGITRAKKLLHLTYATTRMLYNNMQHNAPSRFLSEIPKRLLDENYGKKREEEFGQRSATTSAREFLMNSRAQKHERKPADFGPKGYGQTYARPIDIPGVTKGFVPSKAHETEGAALLFKTGDTVLHKKFGEGTVTAVSGQGADARVKITFTAYGEKEFAAAIAPIVKVDGL
ncbi:MAG: DNA helicase PcrA [Eubacteriales bacterium]|nr:DNA helicase PcrA [Eubacteriales bacterium]MDD3881810.1 DNA helicase PcrA [Eubacteriales bacterium]MDD4513567.1 DNA helicase PcrA [Eubacteriales bacterium]